MELPELEWERNDYDLVLCSGCVHIWDVRDVVGW